MIRILSPKDLIEYKEWKQTKQYIKIEVERKKVLPIDLN